MGTAADAPPQATSGEEKLPPPGPGAWVPRSRRGVLTGRVASSEPAAAPPAHTASAPDLYGRDAPSVDIRKKLALQSVDDSHPEYAGVRRRVQGIVNKLSDANIDPLSAELATVFDSSIKAVVNSALTDVLLNVAATESQVNPFPHAGGWVDTAPAVRRCCGRL